MGTLGSQTQRIQALVERRKKGLSPLFFDNFLSPYSYHLEVFETSDIIVGCWLFVPFYCLGGSCPKHLCYVPIGSLQAAHDLASKWRYMPLYRTSAVFKNEGREL